LEWHCQVSTEKSELESEALVTIRVKFGDSVLHSLDNDMSHLAPFSSFVFKHWMMGKPKFYIAKKNTVTEYTLCTNCNRI
jgi:hypothetical protein